jgi:hypothetical protein
MKFIRDLFIAGVVGVLAYMGLLIVGTAIKVNMARAHSDGHQLYDADCCNQIDCAPVEKVEVVPTQKFAAAGLGFAPSLKLPTQMVITTRHGTVVVPEDFKAPSRRQSRDGRMHACIRQTAQGMKLICLYEPPGI